MRSECPILPNTLPSGDVTPSIAHAEPLGLNGETIVGLPDKSAYCVAICPFAFIFSSSADVATNFPSPCDTGTLYTSPTLQADSHGDKSEATLTSTRVETWREMLLKVSVGEVSVSSVTFP